MEHDNEKTAELLKEIEEAFEDKFGEGCGIAICYTLPQEGWRHCHWITNLKRQDGAKLFINTGNRMIAQTN